MHKRQWCLTQIYFVISKNWKQPETLSPISVIPRSQWKPQTLSTKRLVMQWKCHPRHSRFYDMLLSRTQAEALGPYFMCRGKLTGQLRSLFLATVVSSAQTVLLKTQSLYSQVCKTANFNMLRRKRLKKGSRNYFAWFPWPSFKGENKSKTFLPWAVEGWLITFFPASSYLWAAGLWVISFCFIHFYCQNFLKWTSTI